MAAERGDGQQAVRDRQRYIDDRIRTGEGLPVLRMTFVDADGETGIVNADLTLRYAGRHRDEMAAFVAEAGGDGGHETSLPTFLFQRFAIELYAEFPLAEVEIGDDGRKE